MQRIAQLILITLLLALMISGQTMIAADAAPASQPSVDANPTTPMACDPDGEQDSGALYRICMPAIWNGDLLVFAHGYVSPTEPVAIPEDQMTLPDGTTLSDIANSLGLAFATTSYSTNGLAVRQGVADIVDLIDIFIAEKGEPDNVYLIGASEGGLITTLVIEQHPDLFSGGLAMCGPYGDFQGQINHFGDFRILFDYFFPGLMPGDPINIPDSLIENWETHYEENILPTLQDPDNVDRVDQLLNVAGASYDPAEPETKYQTIAQLLWYNVFATNDGQAKLGGQPFDNQARVYTGSNDDVELNASVQRFSADQAALDELVAYYETTGHLSIPLVTIHTTGDPVVPYWHAVDYRGKVIVADNIALHEHIEVDRYGHCNFEAEEIFGAFSRLSAMIETPPAYQPVNRLLLPLVLKSP